MPVLTLMCPLALRAVALLPDQQLYISSRAEGRALGILKVCFVITFKAKGMRQVHCYYYNRVQSG